MSPFRILVTGASGAVGRQLLADLMRGPSMTIRAVSRTTQAWPAGVQGCVAVLSDARSIDSACDAVDAVVHLAGTDERSSVADPGEAYRVNVEGTQIWLDAARRAGVSRFVFASSAKVYGARLTGTVTEDTACQPLTVYSATRLSAEARVMASPLNGVVLRISNGFGVPPGPVDWKVLVNDFCRQAATRDEIRIQSSGLSWRNVLRLRDVTAALSLSLSAPAGIYNVGSNVSMTLRDLAELVAAVSERRFGRRPIVHHAPPEPDERHEPLVFRVDKFAAAGFHVSDSIEGEIDRTLCAARNVLPVVHG